ncbi:MAG TPA: flagellar hook protein FlgE [Anaerolineaceae bacterium]|nr:flagellar hook protein FlgE [Anaerolineaceae bacterium]
MLRSMFTAISSLQLHQNYLDVVANNLANANTIGYKSNRVLFQDQFYQLLSPGSGPTDSIGGINPTQIGLGLQLGYISPIFTQGMMQNTGRNMDLAIQGNGFFIYDQGAMRHYSREGSLSLDSNGYLVNTASGSRVQGWMTGTDGAVDINLPSASIRLDTSRTLARATTTAQFGGNLSSDTAQGDTIVTTMGVYDSLGKLQSATVEFTRSTTNPYEWAWEITSPTPTAGGTGTITFDTHGNFVQTDPPTLGQVTLPGSTATNPIAMEIDFSDLTMLAADTGASLTSQDGLPTGTFSDVNITPNDGAIYLVYSNGMREQVAQLAIAHFTNPAGLIRAGHTSFVAGPNSGEAEIGLANSGGRGAIAAGYLEASNVDMAQEFTNMILAQRGFQASSRIISVSDEIMQELVNLKR